MMTAKAGELWVAEITFTDSSASKKRPVLIFWVDRAQQVIAQIEQHNKNRDRAKKTDVLGSGYSICCWIECALSTNSK
jgi:hypothetical protein